MSPLHKLSAHQLVSAIRMTAFILWIFFTKLKVSVRFRSVSTPLTMSKWRAYEAWVAFSLPVSGVLTTLYWFSALYGVVMRGLKKLWIIFTKRERSYGLFGFPHVGDAPWPVRLLCGKWWYSVDRPFIIIFSLSVLHYTPLSAQSPRSRLR